MDFRKSLRRRTTTQAELGMRRKNKEGAKKEGREEERPRAKAYYTAPGATPYWY